MIIGPAPHPVTEPLALDLELLGDIVADQITSTGRYIVIAGPHGKHRIWMSNACCKSGFTFIVPADQGVAVRLAATHSFARHLRGCSNGDPPTQLSPTAFQHQRLALLLRLIDADLAQFTRREMAFTLVYPHNEPLNGAAWKCSNERRRTLRLIDEASVMMHGGFRDLLH